MIASMSQRRAQLLKPQPAVRQSHTLRSPWPYVDFKKVSGKVRTVGTNPEMNTNGWRIKQLQLGDDALQSWMTFILSIFNEYKTTCNELFDKLYTICEKANLQDVWSDKVIDEFLDAISSDNDVSKNDRRVKLLTNLLLIHFPYGHTMLDSNPAKWWTEKTVRSKYNTDDIENEFTKMRSRKNREVPHQMFNFHMSFCKQLSETNDKLTHTLFQMIRNYLIKETQALVINPDGGMGLGKPISTNATPSSGKQPIIKFVGIVDDVNDDSAVAVRKKDQPFIEIIDPLEPALVSLETTSKKPLETTSKNNTTIDDDSVSLHVATFKEFDTVFSYFLSQMENMYERVYSLRHLFTALKRDNIVQSFKEDVWDNALKTTDKWLTELRQCTTTLKSEVCVLRYQMQTIIKNLDCCESEDKPNPLQYYPFRRTYSAVHNQETITPWNFRHLSSEEYVVKVTEFIQHRIRQDHFEVQDHFKSSWIIPANIVQLTINPEQKAKNLFESFWNTKINDYFQKTATLFSRMITRMQIVESDLCFEKENLDTFFFNNLHSDGSGTRDLDATQLILNIHFLFGQKLDDKNITREPIHLSQEVIEKMMENIVDNDEAKLLANYRQLCRNLVQLNATLTRNLLEKSKLYFQHDNATTSKEKAAAISDLVNIDEKKLADLQLIKIKMGSNLKIGAYVKDYQFTVSNLQEFHFLMKYCVTKFYDLFDRLETFTTLQQEKLNDFDYWAKKLPNIANRYVEEDTALSKLKWDITMSQQFLKQLDQIMWIWYNFLSDISKDIDCWKITESDKQHMLNPVDKVTELIHEKEEQFRKQLLKASGGTRYHDDTDPSGEEGSIENIVYLGE